MGIRYFWDLVLRKGICATDYCIKHFAETCLITNETYFTVKRFALDTVRNLFILIMI